MKTPYLRQVEVIIGPLSEKDGGGPETDAIKVRGTGSTDTLRINFQVNQPWVSSSIRIYNLSPRLRKALHSRELQVVLRAGWANGVLTELFRGSLVSAFSSRAGADIVTELGLFCGWWSITQVVTKTELVEGASYKNAVISIAQKMPGVTVDANMVNIEDRQVGKAGYTDQGTIKHLLDALGRVQGFNWGVRDGKFWAVRHNGFFQGKVPVLISGKSGYLIRAEPQLKSPVPIVNGVSVNCLFNPDVILMEKFRLESVINPEIDGEYIAHTITHSGDTHSDQWETYIQAWSPQEFKSTEPLVKKAQEWSDIEIIAGTIYGEASGESPEGKKAVGLTIRNRVQHPGKWGDSWKTVCQKKAQFSCWEDHNKSRIEAARESNTTTWKECMAVATDTYSGKTFPEVSLSGNPTNFYSGTKAPTWVTGMTYIGKIGGHRFYNDPATGV